MAQTREARGNEAGGGPPVFIVGVPRSGTTLLAAMLGAHSRLSCGPESGLFAYHAVLPWTSKALLCNPVSWPRRPVDFLFSLERHGKPLPENFGLGREEIASYLRGRGPSAAALMSSLPDLYREKCGKARWVEKSPEHLVYVRQIRRRFPRSPIVRIVRDPRDVALSLLRVPWGCSSFAAGLALWRERDAGSAAFFETDKLSYTLLYEDLVTAPEAQLRKLCAFLGEPFEAGMLDTAESSRNVNRMKEPWKEKAAREVDPGRCRAWREHLDAEQVLVAESLVGDRLAAYYGGSSGTTCATYCPVHPLRAARNYSEVFAGLAGKRFRIWPAHEGEEASMEIHVGFPDDDGWLGVYRSERALQTLRICMRLLRSRLSGRRIYWVCKPPARGTGTRCGRVLCRLLRVVGTGPSPSLTTTG